MYTLTVLSQALKLRCSLGDVLGIVFMVILTTPMGTKLIEVEICILKFKFHFLI